MVKRVPSKAGAMLRKWLDERDVSQAEFAKCVGVAQTAVSSWMKGVEPLLRHAFAIEKFTGIAMIHWLRAERTRRISSHP